MNKPAFRASTVCTYFLATCLVTACGGGSSDSGSPTVAEAESASSTAAIQNFKVTSYPIAVPSGKVFGLANNFFDDFFLPAAPVYNYGFPVPVVPVANADGSMEVAWLDYASGGTHPTASGLAVLGSVNITHISPDLRTSTTTATGIKTYRLLGFTRDAGGNFYLAYNADSSFKTNKPGDPNNANGNELRVARSSKASFASRTWETIVFGDVDNTHAASPGDAGGAGSGTLGFDAANNVLVSYVSHNMAWDQNGVRHQAGILRLIDATTGKVVAPGNSSPWYMGSGWFYSHNFNQRLLVDGSTYYTLAHGDSYPRQLGVSAFTKARYVANDSTVFDKGYWTVPGNAGDNTTNAETGQFFKLSSSSLVIAHTALNGGSAARDVRLVLADAGTGVSTKNAWLTKNRANQQAVMPKIAPLGTRIFLSYGIWDSTSRTNHAITWYGQVLDQALAPVSPPVKLTGIEFVAGQPLFNFKTGPNAGALGWVSGNAQGGLTVNVVQGS